MSYKYDLFICHAFEDKDFVRPLAEALRAQRLAVWFDEFELKPGMGLRESIDQGLLSSRFGLVVLSHAFFSKAWPRWELDGLVQLTHSRSEPTIIPLWHKIRRSGVASYSPSLANIVAIMSNGRPDRAAIEVVRVLRPRPTAVEVAREILLKFEFPAPVLSDDWWLDAGAWSAHQFGEGTFQEPSAWGWWGFRLPPEGDSAEEKGGRIAWAAMQHSWQQSAIEQRITQCTDPDFVLEFIQSQPGLRATVETELDFLLCYVPQLGIPGTGGFLEASIDSVYRQNEASISQYPSRGAPGWALRLPGFSSLSEPDLTDLYFWPTDSFGTSPDANVLAWIDAAAWIASAQSGWLPPLLRTKLRAGLSSHDVPSRLMSGKAETWNIWESKGWHEILVHGPDTLEKSQFVQKATTLFEERLVSSRELLDLTESALELAKRIGSWGVLEAFWDWNLGRRHR